jgi:glycosyltransferase involved in cell wall biosynthesis
MIRVMQVSTRHNVGGVSKLINVLLSNESSLNSYVTGQCEGNEVEFSLDFFYNSGQKLFRIKTLRRTPNLWNDLISLSKIYKLIKSEKPHIIHTHMSKAGLLARLAAILSRSSAKLIHSYHGLIYENYFNRNLAKFLVLIERIIGKYTDAFVLDSQLIAEEIERLSIRPKITQSVITPGVIEIDPNYILRQRDSKVLKILIVARLEQIKRIDRAIEALNVVSKVVPAAPFRVTILGDGQLRAQLERMSREYCLPVEFVGWQSNLTTFYQESNLMLLTSDSEGTPLAIMEAAYLGCPTISTNVGGVADIIEDGRTGVLCSFDTNEIAKAIIDAFNNPNKLQEMSQNAHEKAKKDFSKELFVKKHWVLYELLSSKNNGV